MEAQAARIGVKPNKPETSRTKSRLRLFRERSRARRRERAIRAHLARIRSVQGSEHSHLIGPPRPY